MFKYQKNNRILFVCLGLLAAVTTSAVYLAQGPELNLVYKKTVRSSLSEARLNRNVESITRWPQWFHGLEKVSFEGDIHELKSGSRLRLAIDPRKTMKKKFYLNAEVIEFTPSKRLSLRITQDSTGRLTRLFDQMVWTVEFEPSNHGSMISGISQSQTAHWRSRLFGRISPKILMNQVFYPDIIKLSEMNQPFTVDSYKPKSL